MEQVTVSSKGQIAIPKAVGDLMDLSAGAKLMIEVRGQEIVLSKEPAWKKLHGAAAGSDLVTAFALHKKREREHEDSRAWFVGDSGMDQWQKTSRHPRGRAPRGGRRRTSSTPDERYQRGRGLLLPAEAPQPGPRGVS
jgi:AbrB family looped-hinge helix DNA binding protein